MTYMNDRRRVELALVPALYAMWVRGAMDLMHRAGKSRWSAPHPPSWTTSRRGRTIPPAALT
jgi:hypothetical protein